MVRQVLAARLQLCRGFFLYLGFPDSDLDAARRAIEDARPTAVSMMATVLLVGHLVVHSPVGSSFVRRH